MEHSSVGTGVLALHAEYQDYMSTDPANPQLGIQNLSGNQLTQAPKFKVNAAAQYAWHIPTAALPCEESTRGWTTSSSPFRHPHAMVTAALIV